MRQIYVLLSVLVVFLSFGVFMHQTQYKAARYSPDRAYSNARDLDKLDPAAGISYKVENLSYNNTLNRLDDKKIYLNK